MGIVVQYFLRYTGDPSQFSKELSMRYPCCLQPVEDLKTAFHFWTDLKRCVDAIADPLGAEELSEDMTHATEILTMQMDRLGLS